MTVSEFSDQFDVLVDSYRRFTDFDSKEPVDTIDFNEYEKSVFLTKAQEEFVKDSYEGLNLRNESFEQSEKLRRILDSLVMSSTLTSKSREIPYTKIDPKSIFYTLPDNHLYTIYEWGTVSGDGICDSNNTIAGIPVTHDEYYRLSKNPFKWNRKKRFFRLNVDSNTVEIVCKDCQLTSYSIRYIRKPNPIILVDLSGISVDSNIFKGQTAQTCELHESFHREILERAVRLAMSSRLTK